MKKDEYQQMRAELGLCANIEVANPFCAKKVPGWFFFSDENSR